MLGGPRCLHGTAATTVCLAVSKHHQQEISPMLVQLMPSPCVHHNKHELKHACHACNGVKKTGLVSTTRPIQLAVAGDSHSACTNFGTVMMRTVWPIAVLCSNTAKRDKYSACPAFWQNLFPPWTRRAIQTCDTILRMYVSTCNMERQNNTKPPEPCRHTKQYREGP